jgi:hypothetical protein
MVKQYVETRVLLSKYSRNEKPGISMTSKPSQYFLGCPDPHTKFGAAFHLNVESQDQRWALTQQPISEHVIKLTKTCDSTKKKCSYERNKGV